VSLIVSAYERPNALRTCLSSIVQQTHTDWRVLVVDNTARKRMGYANKRVVEEINDPRVTYINVAHDTYLGDALMNASGHKYSVYKATEIGVDHPFMREGEWLGFPSDDTYVVPWYLERMLAAAAAQSWELVYCDLVAGGPREHHPMQTRPLRCCIDKTCFLLKREWFRGFDHSPEAYPQADGLLLEDLVARGIRHGRLGQCLVCHN
jgi:GT2 family glycosyltransferase